MDVPSTDFSRSHAEEYGLDCFKNRKQSSSNN